MNHHLCYREILTKNPYGKAADLWSLGCLLYTLLIGRPPFQSSDLKETFRRVKKAQYTIPSLGNISLAAKDLIQRLIVLDPLQRISLEKVKKHPFFINNNTIISTVGQHLYSINSPKSINIRGLKPFKQETKHGHLEIQSDGWLLIDFFQASDLMKISPDGKLIRLWSKQSSSQINTEYRYGQTPLSSSIQYRYEYARRFIQLLRAKTPRVILLTESFRAYLMDNAPRRDFHIRYNSGIRVEYFPSPIADSSTSTGKIVIKKVLGDVQVIQNPRIDALEHIKPMETKLFVSECLSRYKQCSEALREKTTTMTIEEGDPPLIIREDVRSSQSLQIIPEMTIPQLTSLINDTINTIYFDRRSNNNNYYPINWNSSSNIPNNFEGAYRVFLPQVGWCLANPAEQFLLLFCDGDTVLLDGRNARVIMAASSDEIHSSKMINDDDMKDEEEEEEEESCRGKWFRIDQSLPKRLKNKLFYFPRFIELLKSGHGHSFVNRN